MRLRNGAGLLLVLALLPACRKKSALEFYELESSYAILVGRDGDAAYVTPEMDRIEPGLRSIPADAIEAPRATALLTKLCDERRRVEHERARQEAALAAAAQIPAPPPAAPPQPHAWPPFAFPGAPDWVLPTGTGRPPPLPENARWRPRGVVLYVEPIAGNPPPQGQTVYCWFQTIQGSGITRGTLKSSRSGANAVATAKSECEAAHANCSCSTDPTYFAVPRGCLFAGSACVNHDECCSATCSKARCTDR
ncbi:MAG: hypothetical protein AMXMBFR34_31660 [Myxococcaceae bacterium]